MKTHPTFKIESDVPIPPRNFMVSSVLGELRETLMRIKAGESFVYPDNIYAYLAAKQTKIKIKIRKLNGGGYRVWKIK